MKVVKKGRNQKGWAGTFKCTGNGNGGGGCGATLLVEASDLYFTRSYDYTGDYDEYVTFSCADCGVETDIPNSKQPPRELITGKQPKKNETEE
jgi:hypothetical protein